MSKDEELLYDDPEELYGSQAEKDRVFQAIEGVKLTDDSDDPDKEYRIAIREAGYLKGDDGRMLINGKWYTMTQAIAREKRIKNLKPFEPGNNWGARKMEKKTSKQILETLMSMRIRGHDIEGVEGYFSVSELAHTVMVQKALNGDLNAYKEILDRMEGKAIPKSDESGASSQFATKKLSDLISFKEIGKGAEDEE